MGKAIKGIEGMTAKDIDIQLQSGAKFVIYMYCVSIVVMSFKRYSDVYFILPGEKASKHSTPFTLLALFFGWWGIPWGPIWTITALSTNLQGGKDVTAQVAAQFKP
ncbi:MAG TPA: hypothetical protein VK808_12945 [Bacteroidia bacterium]|jgi:hypothetical protein|nr:hypothetical protein [Bacteroidia bacterium]